MTTLKKSSTRSVYDLTTLEEILYEETPIEEVIAAARVKGFEVIESTPNTLLLDLDGDEQLNTFGKRLEMVGNKLFTIVNLTASKSKDGNYHVVIEVEESLTTWERLSIQACLGSDWKREALALKKLSEGGPFISVLFRPQPLVEVEI